MPKKKFVGGLICACSGSDNWATDNTCTAWHMLRSACQIQAIAEGGDRDAAAAAPAAVAAAPRAGSEAEGPSTPPRAVGSGAAPPPAAMPFGRPPADVGSEGDAAALRASPHVEGARSPGAAASPPGPGLGSQDPGHPAWRGGWGLDGGSHTPPRQRAADAAEGHTAAELLGRGAGQQLRGKAGGSSAGSSAAESPRESPFASTAVQVGGTLLEMTPGSFAACR